ncbi:MAG TPA: excinuclease ABC subunit UvrA, partial [Spirochaetia bacterium]|nr:excinuclease ABC subunit UvrA [Spirochaetia bacterium]
MSQEYIEIRGARENNLKNVSLKIPKRKITLFTGVSGSGKSSLVFDTIAMEAQRLLAENFSTFLRGFMPKYPQPAADSLANLNMAVVIDQKRLGGGSHSTVGTVTDISSILRLLYSRAGKPSIGSANLFSFNDPKGMCPECNGLGRKVGANLDLFLDESKSLTEGAILYPGYAQGEWEWNILNESKFFDMDKKIAKYTNAERELLLFGKAQKVALKFGGKAVNLTYEGVIEKFTNKYIKKDLKSYSARTQKSVEPYLTMGPCHVCKGARLSPKALSVKVDGYSIAELQEMEVDELVEVIRTISAPEAEPILEALESRLTHLCDIGLEYLSLNR